MSIPSVTTILGNIFPYDNRFFLKSLSREGISKKKSRGELVKGGIARKAGYINYTNLMNNLTNFGSMIHLYAYMKGTDINTLSLPENYQPYIRGLDDFFRRYKVSTIVGEHFVKTDEYQGTFDALLRLTLPGTDEEITVLADFKTWKYYKDFYGIENRVLRRSGEPYRDKGSLDKVAIQLSMYQCGFENDPLSKKYPVDKLAVIRVTRLGTYVKILDYNIEPYLNRKKLPENGAKQKKIGRI